MSSKDLLKDLSDKTKDLIRKTQTEVSASNLVLLGAVGLGAIAGVTLTSSFIKKTDALGEMVCWKFEQTATFTPDNIQNNALCVNYIPVDFRPQGVRVFSIYMMNITLNRLMPISVMIENPGTIRFHTYEDGVGPALIQNTWAVSVPNIQCSIYSFYVEYRI